MTGNPGPVGSGDYVVAAGECMESIASKTGHSWKYLWNLADNAEVKTIRKNPNVLLAGDRLVVPPIRAGEVPVPAEQCHRFRRKGVPSRLRIQVMQAAKPRADEPYSLILDGNTVEGKTDAEGWVDVPIPPGAQGGELIVGAGSTGGLTIPLQLGGMDPVTETIGIQKRLANLGYSCEETGELDDQTRAAIAEFQTQSDLEATGEPDGAFRDRLVQEHGS
ncbi:MAG: peptidoglycan-binding domain-containing protein [Desulfobacteria bacterium]